MRRASTLFVVAACWAFCLLAWAGLSGVRPDGTAAQEQYDAASEACADTEPVNTFPGTESRETEPFDIDGEAFRLVYAITPLEEGEPSSVTVEVLEEDEEPGEGPVITLDGESGSKDIPAGPGTFTLDIVAENASYDITVEDCVGSSGGGNGGGGGVTVEEPPGDIDSADDLVPGTAVSKNDLKKIPNTGGPPVVIGALALLGTALLAGRAVLRR